MVNNEIHIQVEPSETRELSVEQADLSWRPGLDWQYRVPICIRNFNKKNIPAGVTTINTRHINNRLGKLFGFEFKWGGKKGRIPQEWQKNENSEYKTISPDDVVGFWL